MAYEIMQTLHPDPSQWFHSLDDIYYFGGQGGHEETVLYQHYPNNRGIYKILLNGNRRRRMHSGFVGTPIVILLQVKPMMKLMAVW